MKAVLALAALVCVSATDPRPANTQSGIAPDAMVEVVQVRCLASAGSAFYVGPRVLLSVAHVTSASGCFIDGEPVKVIGKQGDFTILLAPRPVDKWLRVDCEGFKRGRVYTAWGFARGLPSLTSVDMVATGRFISGFARLWGIFNVIPGQSGGPIVDPQTGRAVGTVNVYNAQRGDSGSVELKGTVLC